MLCPTIVHAVALQLGMWLRRRPGIGLKLHQNSWPQNGHPSLKKWTKWPQKRGNGSPIQHLYHCTPHTQLSMSLPFSWTMIIDIWWLQDPAHQVAIGVAPNPCQWLVWPWPQKIKKWPQMDNCGRPGFHPNTTPHIDRAWCCFFESRLLIH